MCLLAQVRIEQRQLLRPDGLPVQYIPGLCELFDDYLPICLRLGSRSLFVERAIRRGDLRQLFLRQPVERNLRDREEVAKDLHLPAPLTVLDSLEGLEKSNRRFVRKRSGDCMFFILKHVLRDGDSPGLCSSRFFGILEFELRSDNRRLP